MSRIAGSSMDVPCTFQRYAPTPEAGTPPLGGRWVPYTSEEWEEALAGAPKLLASEVLNDMGTKKCLHGTPTAPSNPTYRRHLDATTPTATLSRRGNDAAHGEGPEEDAPFGQCQSPYGPGARGQRRPDGLGLTFA